MTHLTHAHIINISAGLMVLSCGLNNTLACCGRLWQVIISQNTKICHWFIFKNRFEWTPDGCYRHDILSSGWSCVLSWRGEVQLTDLEPCLNHTHLNQAWSSSVSKNWMLFIIYPGGGKNSWEPLSGIPQVPCTLNFLFHDPLNVCLFVFQVTESHVMLFWLVAGFLNLKIDSLGTYLSFQLL